MQHTAAPPHAQQPRLPPNAGLVGKQLPPGRLFGVNVKVVPRGPDQPDPRTNPSPLGGPRLAGAVPQPLSVLRRRFPKKAPEAERPASTNQTNDRAKGFCKPVPHVGRVSNQPHHSRPGHHPSKRPWRPINSPHSCICLRRLGVTRM